jgi:hypothetical protein
MRNLEFAMRLVSEGVNDMEDRGFKVMPATAREATAYVLGATDAVGSPDKIINSSAKVNQITKRVEEILSKGREKKNPARRPKESPLYVKYLSLKSDEEPFMMQGTKYEYVWAEYPGGIKDIGVYSYANDLVYSYDSFRQMMNLPNPLTHRKGESVRDFTSRCMSEEKASFPKTKQRIAVCLSKSRKRNPLESGASISDDEDINARASNMG